MRIGSLVVLRLFYTGQDQFKYQYLDSRDAWTDSPKHAYEFRSMEAFNAAHQKGGSVFLRLPTGREIPVSESDFE